MPKAQIIRRSTFGPFSRFCCIEMQTRFGTTEWFVTDAEREDELGLPLTIAQADTSPEALSQALNNLRQDGSISNDELREAKEGFERVAFGWGTIWE